MTFSLLAIAGIAALLGYRRLKFLTFTSAILVLWVASTPTVASWPLYSLEKQYPAVSMAETPDADVAIILGGAVGQPLPPRVDIGLSERLGPSAACGETLKDRQGQTQFR